MAPKYIEGTHILISEYACHHCGKLPPRMLDEDGELLPAYTILFRAFEKIRSARGGLPLPVISGYRCRDHEKALFIASLKPGSGIAVAGYMSVHPFGLALDLQADDKADQERIVRFARALTPRPRIGWLDYQKAGQTTIHMDYGQFIEPSYSTDLVAGAEW